MEISNKEKIKAAYALNLWTVSVAQIIDYNDINIMKQEYDTIMNNLNLEKMPKDDSLLRIINQITDEISALTMNAGDQKMIEKKYQHNLNNAVWNAIPSVGAIFASSNPAAIALTLATQIGTGYMNYRRNKAEYEQEFERSEWEIQKNRMQHLHGLQQELFNTAWALATTYEFPDEYRLTSDQIKSYNAALIEQNPVSRFLKLDSMKKSFTAYPPFWYQLGSTANCIYQSDTYSSPSPDDRMLREKYKNIAIASFDNYWKMNEFNLLRHDQMTSTWALEYLELLGLSKDTEPEKARELIYIAEKYSGNALDVLQLCAFAYLRIEDYDQAVRLFLNLVNNHYNGVINTQILSCLYIKKIFTSDSNQTNDARMAYRELLEITKPDYNKYVLKIPEGCVNISNWTPEWNKDEGPAEFYEKQQQKAQEQRAARAKAAAFYHQPIVLVYEPELADISDFFVSVLNDNIQRLDLTMPGPSQCTLKEYKHKRQNYEQSNTHIIFLGDSDEGKKVIKSAQGANLHYHHLGMRYHTSGRKTVIYVRSLKNKQLDDFITLANETSRKYHLNVPQGVTTVRADLARGIGESFSEGGVAASIIACTILSPLLAVGEVLECAENGIQGGINLFSSKKLRETQYCVAIYNYLESNNAIICDDI